VNAGGFWGKGTEGQTVWGLEGGIGLGTAATFTKPLLGCSRCITRYSRGSLSTSGVNGSREPTRRSRPLKAFWLTLGHKFRPHRAGVSAHDGSPLARYHLPRCRRVRCCRRRRLDCPFRSEPGIAIRGSG
jgi:hypothetical protein